MDLRLEWAQQESHTNAKAVVVDVCVGASIGLVVVVQN